MTAPKPPLFTFHKVFDDPTPNAIINLRYVQRFFTMMDATTLDAQDREKMLRILVLVGKKLVSVWKHMEAYRKEERRLIDEVTARPVPSDARAVTVDVSQDLFLEFDEFLVQIKSTLDYLVKVPVPIFGPKSWTLRTFGNKGEDVKNVLRRNTGKKRKPAVEGVIKTLFEPSKAWLELTIQARDKINHFVDGGISPEQFAVYRHPITGAIHRPMWNPDQTIEQFNDICWVNLFRFCEDFTAMMLFFKHKPDLTLFHGEADMASTKSPWVVTTQAQMEEAVKRPGWTKIVVDDAG